jgi:hypothetical protein
MLGFGDFGVAAALVVTILSAALCVVYGVVNWNRDDAPLPSSVHPQGEPDIDNEV